VSDKRFMVYAIDEDSSNNISIECSDIDDMDKYANACKEQGYIEVRTKAKPVMETFYNSVDNVYKMPMCPRCSEPTYSLAACAFCGQEFEWEEVVSTMSEQLSKQGDSKLTREELTREKIMDMKPGREMDALVAEYVKGFRRGKTPPDCDGKYGGEDILLPPYIDETFNYPPKGRISLTFFIDNYSTDITKAFPLMVEKGNHNNFDIGLFLAPLGNGQWMCGPASYIYNISIRDDHYKDPKVVICDTAPEAICKMRLIIALNL